MKILPNRLSQKQQGLIYIVSIILLALAFNFLLLAPLRDQLNSVENKYNSEKAKVNAIETFVLAHPDTPQFLSEVRQNTQFVNMLLPNETEIGSYIVNIQNTANLAGVQLVQIQPAQFSNKAGYREIPVEIIIKGNYFKILDFMKRIEEGGRFHKVNKVDLKYNNGLIEAKVSVSIFSFGTAQVNSKTNTAGTIK